MQSEMRIRKCFGWKTEVKRQRAKCRSRWQVIIKIDGEEMSCADVQLLGPVYVRGQWKGCCGYGDEYVEIKRQLDATDGFFTADLIACSTCFGHNYAHHQELKSIIQWLLPVVFRAVVFTLLVWCGVEDYVSGLHDAADLIAC